MAPSGMHGRVLLVPHPGERDPAVIKRRNRGSSGGVQRTWHALPRPRSLRQLSPERVKSWQGQRPREPTSSS